MAFLTLPLTLYSVILWLEPCKRFHLFICLPFVQSWSLSLCFDLSCPCDLHSNIRALNFPQNTWAVISNLDLYGRGSNSDDIHLLDFTTRGTSIDRLACHRFSFRNACADCWLWKVRSY